MAKSFSFGPPVKTFQKLSLYFQLTISNEGDAEAIGLAIVNTILGKYFLSCNFLL
jgi:hypothetical protein